MKTKWIPYPSILEGETVDLIPLEKEHFEELYMAAADRELWELVPTDCSDRTLFYQNYELALSQRETENQYPFVIRHKKTGKLIGSTRFFEIFPFDRKLEIGWTWIIKDFWGTSVNLECKLLLLTFCFEVLKTNRVQLKTKDNNFRSRKAIEKIGGVFEGVFRKDKVLRDGTTRNAAYYSILDDEWEVAKLKIENLIREKQDSLTTL